jgi:flagellar basal body rod protein FlgG
VSAALYLSGVGARARMSQLEVVANNLANADTTGFKADEPLFAAALSMALEDDRGGSHPGALAFVAPSGIQARHEQGPISKTGGSLDVALQGAGFFQVQTPDGPRYTRAGSFTVNPDGFLAGPAGHPVLGASGPIAVGSRGARIEQGGSVVDSSGNVLGRLAVEEFLEPELLIKEGSSLFRAPIELVGLPVESPRIEAGSLEQSNVKPVEELAKLLILQRAFDASMQSLQADDQASRRLIEEMNP